MKLRFSDSEKETLRYNSDPYYRGPVVNYQNFNGNKFLNFPWLSGLEIFTAKFH